MATIRIAVTGGPGAGKTTLLTALEKRGHRVMPEVARQIIAERLGRGLPPRPEPIEFARAILAGDLANYRAAAGWEGVSFFDRSMLDALGMLNAADGLASGDLARHLADFPYHGTALILPPWREIYRNDGERDQSWDDAVAVFESLRRWYGQCGYELLEVPPDDVEGRCDFVLSRLGLSRESSA